MAITGKFAADFSDFQAAVAKAEVSLKSFETGAGKVQTSLNKVTNSLSGTKLIQDAAIMAEAVERVGGVARLTEAELARVSATAKEAAAKLVAMGQEVPPGIQKIADATKGATANTVDWKGALTGVLGAIGVGFSVSSIVAFGKSVFDSAGKTNDLSQQLGISTDAVQGFKYAAEQSGSTLDAVGTAIGKMSDNLAGGEKGTVAALKAAGLEFSTIRALKPEDAFLAIADALATIPDPMERTRVQYDLLGKGSASLTPALLANFRGTADGAAKMSADTIKALDDAGDAWATLADRVTIISGTLIAAAMNASTRVTSSWTAFALFADNAIEFGVGAAVAMASAQEQASKAAAVNRDVHLGLPPVIKKTAEEMTAAAAAATKYKAAFDAMFDKVAPARAATEQMKMLDAVFRSLAASGQLTRTQIDAVVLEATKLSAEGARLTPRLWDMVLVTNAWSPGLSTAKLNLADLGTQIAIEIPKLDAFSLALQKMASMGDGPMIPTAPRLGTEVPLPKFKTTKAVDQLGELSKAFTQLATIADGSLGSIVKGFGSVVASMDVAKKGMEGFNASAKTGDWAGMAAGIMGVVSAGVTLGNLLVKLTATEMHPGGALGLRSGWLGDAVGTNTIGRQLIQAFADAHGGFAKLHAEMSAAIADSEALWIALTQTVSNADPIAAAAAIKAIQDAFAAAPSTLAAGAGYQTRAELEAVAAKAKSVYDYMLASGAYTAAELAKAFKASADAQAAALGDTAVANQVALDAITAKYGDTISKLATEYKSLSDSVAKEAAEDVMGLVETQERARMADIEAQTRALEAMRDAELEVKKSTFAQILEDGQDVDARLRVVFGRTLEIPYRFVAQNVPGGGGGTSTYTGPVAGGASALRVTVVSQLDGREVARNQVQFLPSELIGAGT